MPSSTASPKVGKTLGVEQRRLERLEPGERLPLGDAELGLEPPDAGGPGARGHDEPVGCVGASLGLDPDAAVPDATPSAARPRARVSPRRPPAPG